MKTKRNNESASGPNQVPPPIKPIKIQRSNRTISSGIQKQKLNDLIRKTIKQFGQIKVNNQHQKHRLTKKGRRSMAAKFIK